MMGEIQCYHGASQGVLKHTFFNTGERTIDFAPTETKSFNAVCDLQGEKGTGDFRIVIGSVYSNAAGDGKTRGELLAKDIELKIPENGPSSR